MHAHHNVDEMAARAAHAILSSPGCSRGQVMEMLAEDARARGIHFDSAPITVLRWINRALSLGLIQKTGEGNRTRYNASGLARQAHVEAQLKLPHTSRPKAVYQESFLESYKPNETFYLDERQRECLAARCPVGSAPLSRLGERDVKSFLYDLTFSSSRLEGNTYDHACTVDLIEHQVSKQGASHTDKVMILNHRDAIQYIIDNACASSIATGHAISTRESDIRTLHALLSSDLLKDPRDSGALRLSPVEIGRSAYIPPRSPSQIASLFQAILAKAGAIENPFEQAFFLNVHLPYLQPFVDCNKRTARVACNIPLLRAGVTPMSWMDVDYHAYTDGILAVYEFNEPALLSKVFVEGYLRSCERFELMRKDREPSRIAVDYRQEVRAAVKALIISDEDLVPEGVDQDRVVEFKAYVEDQVRAIYSNPFGAARFGVSADDVHAHLERMAFTEQTERMPSR
ncbi:Fic family protein [Pelomonas sp. APW6]|uniref:Fic family protein n=1 Tax=Roseateles subflavus TaxID=3053353 RepID=A0ABT7LND5_9BURK|nr:Fic family protein [Pelomonas sp. APW6]MDL5034381.1 Fic family protein [Pelomonas sp. APW6]